MPKGLRIQKGLAKFFNCEFRNKWIAIVNTCVYDFMLLIIDLATKESGGKNKIKELEGKLKEMVSLETFDSKLKAIQDNLKINGKRRRSKLQNSNGIAGIINKQNF